LDLPQERFTEFLPMILLQRSGELKFEETLAKLIISNFHRYMNILNNYKNKGGDYMVYLFMLMKDGLLDTWVTADGFEDVEKEYGKTHDIWEVPTEIIMEVAKINTGKRKEECV
jgi:hypothetical protein